MIINLGCASVDNHIPRDDIFDYHPRRECNIYIIPSVQNLRLKVCLSETHNYVYEKYISGAHNSIIYLSEPLCQRSLSPLYLQHLFHTVFLQTLYKSSCADPEDFSEGSNFLTFVFVGFLVD